VLGQLADGGTLATAIVEEGVTRLALGRRAGGSFGLTVFADVAAAILPGLVRPRTFSFERAE
jgi:protein-L-isoaspartate(D-aspartate) O-methyltransferase